MYIIHFKAMLPVSKNQEILQIKNIERTQVAVNAVFPKDLLSDYLYYR